jgi:hypothetical protein
MIPIKLHLIIPLSFFKKIKNKIIIIIIIKTFLLFILYMQEMFKFNIKFMGPHVGSIYLMVKLQNKCTKDVKENNTK